MTESPQSPGGSIQLRGRVARVEVRAPEPSADSPRAPSSLARRLALAHVVERLVVEGRLESYAHAARLFGVTRARMSQVTDLLLLPVEVQERILLGTADVREHDVRGRGHPRALRIEDEHVDSATSRATPRNGRGRVCLRRP